MNARTNLILFLCAMALAAFIVGIERRKDTTGDRLDRARHALDFDPEKVSAFRIETPAFTVEAEREDDRWRIVQPVRVPADATEVSRILLGIHAAPGEAVVPAADIARRGTALRDYGLDRPIARLSLTGPGIDLQFEIGEPGLLGRLYLRRIPGGDILATGTNLLAALPSGLSALRDRTLFPPAAEARQVRIRRPDGFLHLTRGNGGAWRILQPAVGRAERAAAAGLVGGILSARVLEFVRDGAVEGAPYGLDETAVELTVDFDRDTAPPVVLQIGRAQEQRAGAVYARRAGGDSIFTVSADIARLLATPVDGLRDRRLVPMLPEDIGAVAIERADRRIRIVREGNAWRIVEPVAAAAEEPRVRAFLQEWTGTRIEEFAPPASRGPASSNETRIALYRRTPGLTSTNGAGAADVESRPSAVTLLVRTTSLDLTPVHVTDADGTTVVLIKTKAPGFVAPDPLRFRDRAVLDLAADEVGGMILSRAGVEQRIVRGSTNQFVNAEGDPVSATDVARRLTLLAGLRATALVAENPAERISYGLDPPAATLTVTLRGEGGLTRSLLFGRTSPEGTFAAIRGQDLVFLLDSATAAILQADLFPKPATPAARPPTHPAPEAAR